MGLKPVTSQIQHNFAGHCRQLEDAVAKERASLALERAKFEEEKKQWKEVSTRIQRLQKSERILLDVGGQKITTTVGTMSAFPGSVLDGLVSGVHQVGRKPEDGSIPLEADPTTLQLVLDYCNYKALPSNITSTQKEAIIQLAGVLLIPISIQPAHHTESHVTSKACAYVANKRLRVTPSDAAAPYTTTGHNCKKNPGVTGQDAATEPESCTLGHQSKKHKPLHPYVENYHLPVDEHNFVSCKDEFYPYDEESNDMNLLDTSYPDSDLVADSEQQD